MSRYDAGDAYCYPGTAVLRNKANLTDQAALDAFEADITAVRLLELGENPVQGQFNLAHLQAIHHAIFQDVYDWAGQLRTVDISRGSSRFANVMQIEPYAQVVFSALAKENWLKGCAPDHMAGRLAHYLSEINALHPFREGNGRAQRVPREHTRRYGIVDVQGSAEQLAPVRAMVEKPAPEAAPSTLAVAGATS